MSHITASVEYGVHGLVWLIGQEDRPMSSRELAELTGVSPSFVAKIFPKLEKAGIVRSSEGVRGGYLLSKPAKDISFLDIIDAIEGEKPLFDCREVRLQCPLFGKSPPSWAAKGTCAVHAVMLRAEKAMREALASQSLGDVAEAFGRKAPAEFRGAVKDWLDDNADTRVGKPEPAGKRKRRRTP
jgi:Rrf2 family protein